MGLCFSKKKKPPPDATSKKVAAAAVADDKAKKTVIQPKSAAKAEENAVKAKAVTAGAEEKKKKRAPQEESAAKQLPVTVVPSAPVRTSSCTKDEVDAILIQCGRLSRSSSGTGRTPSRETGSEGGHRRRRSGSKRSYDFDQERKLAAGAEEEGDWESGRPVSRPSPHRGSPQRKRSGSRERSGGSGSRRASRSPGRRGADVGGVSSAATGGGERARQQQQQQPGKMVSVPAREKGREPSPAAAASGIRCASPRSRSPARMMSAGNENACSGVLAAGPTPVLSLSSSRKAEQSPYRRNPMAELDENTLPRNTNTNAKPQKKFTDDPVPAAHTKATAERVKEASPAGTASIRSGTEKAVAASDATAAAASDTRPLSAKTSGTRTASTAGAESLSQRPRSRRASRDFDQGSNNSYASQILEDIQNYHEQHQAATPSFLLPACVAKACSILDAVADVNSCSSSSSGTNRTHYDLNSSAADDKGSVNAAPSAGTDHTTRVAAARRHVHVPVAARDVIRSSEVAAEPQESAGSNSVSAVPCTPSWEPASVESSERTWSDEVVDQGCAPTSPAMNRPRQGRQSSGRSRAGSSGNGNNSLHRGRSSAHRGSGSVASGRSGVRTVSAVS